MKQAVLLGFFLSCLAGCGETATPHGGDLGSASNGDGATDCLPGSTVQFDPPLVGEGVEVSVTITTDLGENPARFSSPFTCEFQTGLDPDRTSHCSGVSAEIYSGTEPDEVGPPIMLFEGEPVEAGVSYSATGISWGMKSDSATVKVMRDGKTVFNGEVTLEEADCSGVSMMLATAELSL